MRYDVVTFGETMLRLTPPAYQRISQANDFEIHVGGSESNTAVALSRLGLNVAWVSRMTANPLGKKIVEAVAAHGVDTTHVVWTDQDRVGTYYLERGTPPRGSAVYYDRKDSAMSRITIGDLPDALFHNVDSKTPPMRVFHTTGISLGLSPSARETTERAISLAKKSGAVISFDVNHRARLWSAVEARSGCQAAIGMADVIFIPARDAAAIYAVDAPSVQERLERLAEAAPRAIWVMTLGADGAAALLPDGEFVSSPGFSTGEVERLGGGDAFSGGFLYGWLKTGNVERALRWGNATAALKYTIPSDLPLIELNEVETLVRGTTKAGVAR